MEVLQKGKGWEGAKLTFLAQSGHRAQSEVCGRFALLIGVPPKSRGPRRPIDVSTHTRQAQPAPRANFSVTFCTWLPPHL